MNSIVYSKMLGFLSVKKLLGYSAQKYLKTPLKNASFLAATAETSSDQRHMLVRFNNGENTLKSEQLKYPLMWLRDNCQCSSCFHSQTKSRSIDWTKFNKENAQLKSFSVENQVMQVTWQDNHVSKFDLEWLHKRNFTAENRQKYINTNYRPKPQIWSKTEFVMKEFQAADIFETDEGLYHWLKHLTRYGVNTIKNAALTSDQCHKLANRIAFIRETHFGKQYHVRADPKAKNFSYTSNALQFHSDLPFYEYTPGVTVLHCIAQTNSPGALSLLVDGFYVAKRLKKENPNAFKCLSTTLVNWCDYGEEAGFGYESILRYPVICLDYEGNVNRINHSVTQRDSFFSIDVEQVDEWYDSLRAFIDLLYEEAVYFKIQPGDILTFSNTRLLHGRTGYVDTEANVRHLVGVFVDWDEVFSRLRVLENDMRLKD